MGIRKCHLALMTTTREPVSSKEEMNWTPLDNGFPRHYNRIVVSYRLFATAQFAKTPSAAVPIFNPAAI